MPCWWACSLGARLGSNGRLVGASANLTFAGIAERGGAGGRFVTETRHVRPMLLVPIVLYPVNWLRRFA